MTSTGGEIGLLHLKWRGGMPLSSEWAKKQQWQGRVSRRRGAFRVFERDTWHLREGSWWSSRRLTNSGMINWWPHMSLTWFLTRVHPWNQNGTNATLSQWYPTPNSKDSGAYREWLRICWEPSKKLARTTSSEGAKVTHHVWQSNLVVKSNDAYVEGRLAIRLIHTRKCSTGENRLRRTSAPFTGAAHRTGVWEA